MNVLMREYLKYSGGCENVPPSGMMIRRDTSLTSLKQMHDMGLFCDDIRAVLHHDIYNISDELTRRLINMEDAKITINNITQMLAEFDPFVSGQRFIIDTIPSFMRKLPPVVNINRKYKLYPVDKKDVPKVHYDKITKTWTSEYTPKGSEPQQPRIVFQPEYELFSDNFLNELVRLDIDHGINKALGSRCSLKN